MNRLYRILAILIASFTITACDDFLDRPPTDEIDFNRYFATQADAETALIGTYNRVFINGPYIDILLWTLMSSDDVSDASVQGVSPGYRFGNDFETRDNLRADNGDARNIWANSYRAIFNLNVLIREVGEMDDALFIGNRKQEILGEARMLRGFLYFYLVQLYGRVPLVLDPTTAETTEVARTPVDDIYNAILEDVGFAEGVLPETYPNPQGGAPDPSIVSIREDKGRFTRYAAKMLLSRIFMVRGRWAEAAQKANEIIISNRFELLPNFSTLYQGPRRGQGPVNDYGNTEESITEIQTFPGNDPTGGMMFFFLDNFPPAFGVNPSLLRTFRDSLGGARSPSADSTIRERFSAGEAGAGGPIYAVKFVEFYCCAGYENVYGTGGTPNPDNYFVFRYAEAFLNRAEALAEADFNANRTEALAMLNVIRERANLRDYTVADAPTLSAFRQLVRRERRMEFFFEGQRWFDLVRWGEVASRTPIDDPNKILMPIPQSEFVVNPALAGDQNPGY